MKLEWEGEEEDRLAAIRAAEERDRLEARVNGAPIVIANEFSEVQVSRVETRNGSRAAFVTTQGLIVVAKALA